ncbi:unnamed protein product, partial [Discosporangium mesarthrocarpum]
MHHWINFLKDGYPGDKAMYCPQHKLANMEDVVNRHCQYDRPGAQPCRKCPSYAFEGEKVFCATHKQEGMVDVKSRRCKIPNCWRVP